MTCPGRHVLLRGGSGILSEGTGGELSESDKARPTSRVLSAKALKTRQLRDFFAGLWWAVVRPLVLW